MKRATKVRIYPTDAQAAFLNAQFGAVRFAYNKALHIQRHMYLHHGVSLKPKHDLKPLLAVAKRSRKYGWLKSYDSQALQQAIINLDKAFANYFAKRSKRGKDGKGGKPKFKSKHGPQSSYHPNGKVLSDAIQLPKMTPIKANLHRAIIGQVSSITITRSPTGKHYASILCDDGLEAPEKARFVTTVTGCDMGLSHYLVQSNGHKTANPRHLINASRNLRRKQQALSRKQRGSANRSKARRQLAALHERVANARADFQHKLSRTLVDETQAAICVETLKTANMMKNRKLARAISDAGWSGFISKLEYKATAAGVHLVKIDQWFASSKTCHCCGHKLTELKLSERSWQCPSCLVINDRDLNAALNIRQKGILELKAAGLVVSAHGGQRNSVNLTVAA